MNQDSKNSFLPNGAAIRAKRAEKGLSQFELAENAKLTVKTISRMENGEQTYLSTLLLVANVLGVEVKTLLLKENDITEKQNVLDGADRNKEIKKINKIQISQFREELKKNAIKHFNEKLHQIYSEKPKDYQQLELEIGTIENFDEKLEKDRNRKWDDFAYTKLISSEGVYILSSDTGAGKTTFLRDLQIKMIEQKKIPLFFHASELEKLKFDDVDSFIKCISKILNDKFSRIELQNFITENFKKFVLFG